MATIAERIPNKDDRKVLSDLMVEIFEDDRIESFQMVCTGDILNPLIQMYELGFRRGKES